MVSGIISWSSDVSAESAWNPANRSMNSAFEIHLGRDDTAVRRATSRPSTVIVRTQHATIVAIGYNRSDESNPGPSRQ